jgi:hypothetical protein
MSLGHGLPPRSDGRPVETAMEGMVVDAGNLMHEPGLQFIQAEDGDSLRIDAAFGDTAVCRAWQDAKGAHHRADQAYESAPKQAQIKPLLDY